jgi:hypothetical protein
MAKEFLLGARHSHFRLPKAHSHPNRLTEAPQADFRRARGMHFASQLVYDPLSTMPRAPSCPESALELERSVLGAASKPPLLLHEMRASLPRADLEAGVFE